MLTLNHCKKINVYLHMYVPYSGNVWLRESLANLVIRPCFAKLEPAKFKLLQVMLGYLQLLFVTVHGKTGLVRTWG